MASFTSALPKLVPSSSQRGGHQFRRRSNNISQRTHDSSLQHSSSINPLSVSTTQGNGIPNGVAIASSSSFPKDDSHKISVTLVKSSAHDARSNSVPSASFYDPASLLSSPLADQHPTVPLKDFAPESSFSRQNDISTGFSQPSRLAYVSRSQSILNTIRRSIIFPTFGWRKPLASELARDEKSSDDNLSASDSESTSGGPTEGSTTTASFQSVFPTGSPASRHPTIITPSNSSTALAPPSTHGSFYQSGDAARTRSRYTLQALTSPRPGMFSSLADAATSLASPRMLSSIGRTTANFTRKFPLPWSSPGRLASYGFVPLGDSERNVGLKPASLYLAIPQDSRDGFGLDGDSLRIARWTPHKWVLATSVLMIFVIGLGGVLVSLGFWLRTWPHSDIVRVIDWDILLYTTVAAGCLLLSSLVGLTGTLLNSRPLLAFYNVLLWPSLVSTATIGYAAYKRRTYNLGGKINEGWSRDWDEVERLIIQNSLRCCGLFNPLHQATFSKLCYPRSSLPGCKTKLVRFEAASLDAFYKAAFSGVGVVLLSIIIAILCSNHVNRLFGKGLPPRQYRLSLKDVHANARAIISATEGTLIPDQPMEMHRRGEKNLVA